MRVDGILGPGLFALSVQATHAFASPKPRRSAYPFNELVAFGDELSDNGNGSYAHNITGNPANVYGFGTWTDGPVAVSYLANLLGVPLRDLAWGGCCGGGSFGATIDNNYTKSPAEYNGQPVPSILDQIYNNYTKTPKNIKNSLQFIWTGQNDLSLHTDAFWAGDPQNGYFANNISTRIVSDAEYLVKQGSPYVFVSNIYPKHLAPVTVKYLCSDGGCVQTWGTVIQQANTAIKNALSASPYSKQFIYYDVFGFMVNVMNNKNSYGFTVPLAWFCDGDGNGNWTACISGTPVWEGAKEYFWMNYIQPTTVVHQLIAQDMKKTIDAFFGMN